MDAINARSTSSKFMKQFRVAEERQEFREALRERDLRCVATGANDYEASHILAYAHENAVSWHDQ